jgi:hypothetical protein
MGNTRLLTRTGVATVGAVGVCPSGRAGTSITAEFVIDADHRLFKIEKSFRMSKHDPQARPMYHHKRESIDAHLTVVVAA